MTGFDGSSGSAGVAHEGMAKSGLPSSRQAGVRRAFMAQSPGCSSSHDAESIWRLDQAALVRTGWFSAMPGSFSQAVEVRAGIRRSAIALRAPDRLGEALQGFVQRRMPVLFARKKLIEKTRDAGRLVDGELLLEREVQAHVQERVRFVGVVLVPVLCRRRKHRVVLRM